MTKHWTLTFFICCIALIGCGDSTRKQLTGIKRPVSVSNLDIKSIEPVKTKVEHLLESGEITKKSQMDPSDVSLILLGQFNEKSVYTGYIINGFDANPFRGSILTLKIEPTGTADQSLVEIISGRGDIFSTTALINRSPEIQLSEYKITLHKEMDCLIIKKINFDYSGVVCKASPIQKVEKTEIETENEETNRTNINIE
jgi:hypothetical protein